MLLSTDASALSGTVTIADPMKSGETYHLKMRVWDKNKAENELTAEVDIAVGKQRAEEGYFTVPFKVGS